MPERRRLVPFTELEKQAPVLTLVRRLAGLAVWRTGLVKSDLGPQSLAELGLPSGGGQAQRTLGSRDGLGEPADFRIGGCQGRDEYRISASRDLVRPSGQPDRLDAVA